VAELTGLSTRLSVIRKVGSIIRYLKDKQEDAGLEVISFVFSQTYH
jgi:hypothetical protein